MWVPLKGCMKQALDQGLRPALQWLWTTANCLQVQAGAGGQIPPCRPCHRPAEEVGKPWAGWALSMGWGPTRSPSPSAYASSGCTDVPTQTKGRSLGPWIIYKDSLPWVFGLINRKLHSFHCSSWTSLLICMEKSCPSRVHVGGMFYSSLILFWVLLLCTCIRNILC